MVRKTIPKPDLRLFDESEPYAKNHLLLDWLSDDEHRAKLYGLVNDRPDGQLTFPSRAVAPVNPPPGHEPAVMVTRRDLIEDILLNNGRQGRYSNQVYAALDGGNFMLALDPGTMPAHDAQREVFKDCFPRDRTVFLERSHAACQAAAILGFQNATFDLAQHAEQCALRFCQNLLGYALQDFPLLETALSLSYQALVYQVFGRHFATDPLAIDESKSQIGALVTRTAQLIDAYAADDDDALTGCDYRSGFEPVLRRLATHGGGMSAGQRAVVAVGAAIGSVGNVQAAVCIAMKALFAEPDQLKKAIQCVAQDPIAEPLPLHAYGKWKTLLQDSLRANPPIPFLPRTRVDVQPAQDVILALGGGTWKDADDDPLIWGLPMGAAHWCAGREMAWPLIIEIVRQLLALPDLAQALDPKDAKVIGLKKRWGFVCESYPLTYRRDKRIAQSSLNVMMPLKQPTQQSAAAVRELIRAGAPRIEQALRAARQVHFAWFEIIDDDSVCVLHTVYDGPFDAYIQDFALKVGDLFDLLFEHIEAAPPTPVRLFPNDFVALIKLFDIHPAAGYFFSAYPQSDAAQILRDSRP